MRHLTPDISRPAKPGRLDGVVMPHAHPMTLREAMVRAANCGRAEGWPRCYYWAAVWWRLHAKESKAPREPLQYSRSQMALYRDIERRPEHYKSWMRPAGMSDWQWSGLGHNT